MGERLMLLTMDEFFFMNPASFTATLPLLANGAALLLTSSMSANADDEIARMIRAKLPDGRDAVMRLDWIRACHECTAQGIAARCTHILQRPQHFQRRVDGERLRALMKPFGDEGYDREMLNVGATSPFRPAFERAWLQPLKDRSQDHVNTLREEHGHFFVSLDPAGQGFSQNVLLSLLILDKPTPSGAPYTIVITGAEVCPVRNTDELGECVAKHIAAVRRQVTGLSMASAIVVVESNLPLIAESVKLTLERRGVPRCCVMSEDRKRSRFAASGGGAGATDAEVRAGTRTTRQNKPAMVMAIHQALMYGALRFHSQFVVAQPEMQPQDEGFPRDNVVAELENFKCEVKMPKPNKRAYARPTMTWSGRYPGGGRARDDYVMALGFVLLMHSVFMSSPDYRAYR